MTQTLTLRERKARATKRAILEALVDLVRTEGIHAFSVQAVADRAEVSHRTVYRYFPTKEAMLEALGEFTQDVMRARSGWDDLDGADSPLTPARIGEVVEIVWEALDAHPHHAEAYVGLSATTVLPTRRERSRLFERVLRPTTEHLSAGDAEAVAAIIRALTSSAAWHFVRRHTDADPKALRKAARWAIETLVGALDEGRGPTDSVPTPEEDRDGRAGDDD